MLAYIKQYFLLALKIWLLIEQVFLLAASKEGFLVAVLNLAFLFAHLKQGYLLIVSNRGFLLVDLKQGFLLGL